MNITKITVNRVVLLEASSQTRENLLSSKAQATKRGIGPTLLGTFLREIKNEDTNQ